MYPNSMPLSLGRGLAGLGVLLAAGGSLLVPGRAIRAQEAPAGASSAAEPSTQRLVMAHYYYSYQGDSRKPVPYRHVRDDKGFSLLTSHPWDSVGPWMSFDRSQWHKGQFQLMAGGGIDVALCVYRGDKENRQAYAIKGLDMLTQGLKELRSEGLAPLMKVRDYPLVGMALDLGGLAEQYGGPVDLKDADVQRSLYGMIRDFYSHVPEEFRASIQLPASKVQSAGATGEPANRFSTGRGQAYIVRLMNDQAVKSADASFVANINKRFAAEFGAGLVWIGTPELQDRVKRFDSVAPFPAALDPAVVSDAGWIRTATLGPGYDDSVRGEGATIRSRENGARTIQDLNRIHNSNPEWIVFDSWNDYPRGSEIAPTLENGLLYRDLIRGAILQFKATSKSLDFGATILKSWAPRYVQPGRLYQMEVLVQNSGLADWDSLNLASLSYQWLKDGKVVGERGGAVTNPGQAHGEARTYLLAVSAPLQEGKFLPAGEYELQIRMTRRAGGEEVWFGLDDNAPYRIPITVGGGPALHPYWVHSTLPAVMRRDATYPVRVRLRNDGAETWKKGAVAVGYRWRKVSTYLKGAATDLDEVVGTGKSVPLPKDVLPGQMETVDVLISTVAADGKPLAVWSPKFPWNYVLEWDVFDGEKSLGQSGGAMLREATEIVERDPAPSFIGCNLPQELVAGKKELITVGIRNNGPETWKGQRDKVAVHWYYLDGTEASWNDDSLPLPEDVPPFSRVQVEVPLDRPLSPMEENEGKKKPKGKKGEPKVKLETVVRDAVLRDVPVRVPYYFGPMYCVLDLVHDGQNSSSLPASKGSDILVIPVNIVSPTFTPLPISAYYDTDGISSDVDRRDGNLDGRFNSFPAEYLPPYVPRPSTNGPASFAMPIYPSGLWVRPLNDFEATRACFLYPSKNNGTPNMMSCNGQRVTFGSLSRTAVHLAALATDVDVVGEFTLYYTDGTTDRQKLTFTHWNDPPKHGERIAFSTPHRHTAVGDDPGSRCYVAHHILKPDPLKVLSAIGVPRQRAIKIMAITLEGAALRPE